MKFSNKDKNKGFIYNNCVKEKIGMKTALKIIVAGLKFILVICIAVCMWIFITPYFRIDRNKEGDLFRNIPENCLDVIALGSSHMQYAFNPAVFYKESGYYSYVLGSSCQPLSMSTSLLEEALKTQKPSLVFVDVFTLLEQSDVCYADGMFYKAIDEMTGETRLSAADKAPESVSTQYKYDLLMNHDQWKNVSLKNLDTFLENAKSAEGYNDNLGHVPMDVENPRYAPLITYEVTEEKELSDSAKKDIDELIALCKKENIHLVFIKTPYIIDQDSTNTLNAIWKYLSLNNSEYIDFIELAEDIEWFIDMDGDTWHNNSWGAEIITKYLANYAEEHNYVTSHVENTTYKNLLENASTYTAKALMNRKNVNIYRLLDEASKYPSVVVMNYSGSNKTSLGEYESNALQALGMSKDFLNQPNGNYYAVVENGVLVQESEEPFALNLNGLNIEITADKVVIGDTEYEKTGEMQVIFTDANHTWTNDINIDYASKWFWKNGCDGFTCE